MGHENFIIDEFTSGYFPDMNIQHNNILGTDVFLQLYHTMCCIMELIHIIVMSTTTNWVWHSGNKTDRFLKPFHADCCLVCI